MNKIIIGIFGAVINNQNLGCQALTYSLISLLDRIEKDTGILVEKHIFEMYPDTNKVTEMCRNLQIQPDNIFTHQVGSARDFKNYCRHFADNARMMSIVKKCQVIIDLTEGDSFADIYGDARFKTQTNIKYLIEKSSIPLVLGPQTYGPFIKDHNKKLAKKVFEGAYIIFSRDEPSAELVYELTGRKPLVTTDLAFQLPYQQPKKDNDVIKVGFNVSGLLTKYGFEGGNNNFSLRTNYDEYVDEILNYFCGKSNYEVYLIPHVGNDERFIELISKKYPKYRVIPLCNNPVSIKNEIAKMDIFIGSRMHATVAAFTSGVVTIPVAYSRKFCGLFGLVEYEHTVDLQELTTKDAVEKTINEVENWMDIQKDLHYSLEISKHYSDLLYNEMKKMIQHFSR